MRLLVVVGFLNEETYLPVVLECLAAQARRPDRLVLLDDGSTDRSPAIAGAFAAKHSYADVLRRPPRPPEPDRLAGGQEFDSFIWAVDQLREDPYDVIVKMDADLRLPPDHLQSVMAEFERDPRLGIAGAFLSVATRWGGLRRERSPADHVRGPNKFYRRACLDEIRPLPILAGWEGIDEPKAHARGWRTAGVAVPSGDPVHMRPTGAYNGKLRGYRRMGSNAWTIGAHPLAVGLGGVSRMRDPPLVLSGFAYVSGWAIAALRRRPRADAEVRAIVRREQLLRIRGYLPFARRAASPSVTNALGFLDDVQRSGGRVRPDLARAPRRRSQTFPTPASLRSVTPISTEPVRSPRSPQGRSHTAIWAMPSLSIGSTSSMC